MIRLLWTVFLGVLALAVVGLELDRAARFDLALARMVPAPFRAFALGPLVKADMAAGDFGNGLVLARLQLRARPMPAESVSDFALAQIAIGQTDRGLQSYEVASARGWRDTGTQLVIANIAAQSEQWDDAAKRLAGFLAASSPSPERDETALLLLSRPELAQAFGQLLGRNPVWRDSVMAWSYRKVSPATMSQMVTAGSRSGAQFDCSRIADYARAAIDIGALAAGEAMWSTCSKEPRLLATDLTFRDREPADAPKDPFAWEYPSEPDLTVDPSGGALQYELTSDLTRRAIATKRIALPAGTYPLQIATASASGTEIALDVRCPQPHAYPIAKRTASGKWLITVPASQCPAQRLILIGSSGQANGIRLSF